MRSVLMMSALIVLLGSAVMAREAAPFRAGSQPEKKITPQPIDRAKIVDEIKADLNDVVDQLNKNDPGAQTRAKQQRILKNLDRLLEPDDPPPPTSSNSNNPPKPMSPPPDSPSPEPKSSTANPPPAAPKVIPQPQAEKPAQVQAKSTNAESLPRTPEEMQKAKSESGRWGEYPPRLRPEMDAYARGRFIRNYEELLREYYRSLAEGNRRVD